VEPDSTFVDFRLHRVESLCVKEDSLDVAFEGLWMQEVFLDLVFDLAEANGLLDDIKVGRMGGLFPEGIQEVALFVLGDHDVGQLGK